MFERFTSQARAVVTVAVSEAQRRRDRHVGTEHVLLGAIATDDPLAGPVIADAGMDLQRARAALDAGDLDALSAVGVEIRELPRPEPDPPARGPFGRFRRPSGHLPFTGGAKHTLERALRHALQRGDRHIGVEHILLALTDCPPRDPAHQLLAALHADPAAVRADLERRLDRAA
jgi:ATP-dependent Clp protease ATP-binding subunit ClpA